MVKLRGATKFFTADSALVNWLGGQALRSRRGRRLRIPLSRRARREPAAPRWRRTGGYEAERRQRSGALTRDPATTRRIAISHSDHLPQIGGRHHVGGRAVRRLGFPCTTRFRADG